MEELPKILAFLVYLTSMLGILVWAGRYRREIDDPNSRYSFRRDQHPEIPPPPMPSPATRTYLWPVCDTLRPSLSQRAHQ